MLIRRRPREEDAPAAQVTVQPCFGSSDGGKRQAVVRTELRGSARYAGPDRHCYIAQSVFVGVDRRAPRRFNRNTMFRLTERSLDWALKHLRRYYDSDFFPKLPEITTLAHNWGAVKPKLMDLDLTNYGPRSPAILLAPKPNDNFRVVHQLEPIDAVIYAALIFEIAESVEDFRIPASEHIAFSYRITPTVDGSFFGRTTRWSDFISQTKQLANEHLDGFVFMADITDFYNQIYSHRVQNLVDEAGQGQFADHSKTIARFLMGVNKSTSRGIPVGPAASIVLAELVLADIDRKVLNYTRKFTRYVDDIRVFFNDKGDALNLAHELTRYLYSSHRLVLSSSKTRIMSTKHFLRDHFVDEEAEEQLVRKAITAQKTEEAYEEIVQEIVESFDPYDPANEIVEPDYAAIQSLVENEHKFQILSDTYKAVFESALSGQGGDASLLRHVLKRASKYRIRTLVPTVLKNFDRLIPSVREVVLYLRKVLSVDTVENHADEIRRLWDSPYAKIPFVNTWLCFLFRAPAISQAAIDFDHEWALTTRDRALFALVRDNPGFSRDYRGGVDLLGIWDKRAVLMSAARLPVDERRAWLNSVAAAGDWVDQAIAKFVGQQTHDFGAI